MAVSDVLFEAGEEIKRYMAEQPEAYDGMRPQLADLLQRMDGLRRLLDMPPAEHLPAN